MTKVNALQPFNFKYTQLYKKKQNCLAEAEVLYCKRGFAATEDYFIMLKKVRSATCKVCRNSFVDILHFYKKKSKKKYFLILHIRKLKGFCIIL